MPGILPMKVIKVGNSSQSRIAQACDRCRSKKIRCDGIRPCCSQCANVGFECKTSDKLSRRAFPRGYTESLEDRVRTLEAEVRDLKNLLDEKDEKIDVLSRIHSFSPHPHKSASRSPAAEETKQTTTTNQSGEGVIQVQHSPSLLRNPTPDAPFAGPSSTRAFVDVFTSKLEENGKSASSISTQALTESPPMISYPLLDEAFKTPPRLVSDQLINIFFQEWAPLYPVVHRPTILKTYDHYLTDADSLASNKYAVAQLNLIFGIAALSARSRTNQDPAFFEQNWYPALESLSGDVSIATLQCYILAQMYCTAKADYKALSRYRGLAVGLVHQLGLHQSQKRFSMNPLTSETRKKVFWCQYVLDRFSAALTGLPALLREDDIRTEYPADVDDENVTETGFLPTLPGESTRLSSALALFSASRILNKVLEDLYPSPAGYEIPISKLHVLSEQLDEWSKSLPPHLRLEFAQDKPSTNVTSSRSPLLSMVYYFIRTLIHRPAVCFGDSTIASASVLALSDSSKHMIQILDLLDERRMSLSFCMSRKELVFLSGLGLLWQNMGLKRDSKLAKESQKILATIIDQLESESARAAAEFTVVANLLISVDGGKHETAVKQSPEMGDASLKSKSPKKQYQPLKSRGSVSGPSGQPARPESQSRRATITNASPPTPHRHIRSSSRSSLPAQQPEPRMNEPSLEYNNFEYFPLNTDSHRAMSCSDVPKNALSMADWEFVVSDMAQGHSNIFTGIYGGKECGEDHGPFASLTAEFQQQHPHSMSMAPPATDAHSLSPEAWSSSSGDLGHNQGATTQSLLSYSEESLGSAEDVSPLNDLGLHHQDNVNLMDPFKGIIIPAADDEVDDFGLVDGWDRRLAV
ncbi:acetate regulatory DNA binding protein FacB [Paecilomyces variotii No. 5]|uniref:Acetate regulatory DNA binding protein FacB n=1 Tax=Byssochlamys spectabilis (strain No. 5 / NBRC 109023) TaxID=1356009 RepID=V5GCN5_BYSSN|nr:acetate regulatory DNA binding protein FacB [Paecilomyces variotii No. 5]